MGIQSRFRVFHIHHNDHIAVVQLDQDLLAPEVGILDHESGTLRPLKGGSVFTLIPVDDHAVSTLQRVKAVYENITTKPAAYFSTNLQRMDELLDAVRLMFGEVAYTLVESKEDMQNLLTPPKDYEPKKVKFTVLGDMLKNAEEAAGLAPTPDGACDNKDTGHVHGPNCKH